MDVDEENLLTNEGRSDYCASMRLGAIAATVLLALTASGCGDNDEGSAPAEPETFDVVGTLTLRDPDGVTYAGYGKLGEECSGEGGYSEIRAGASVVIRGSGGEKLRLGQLRGGTLLEDSTRYVPAPCAFPFRVDDVPRSGSVYSVEVARRGEIDFDEDRALNLSLTLG